MKRLFMILLGAIAVLALPRQLGAQNEPLQMNAVAEPRSVEVGEPFKVMLHATVTAGAPGPADPKIALPDGLRTGSPSLSTEMQMSQVNGRFTQRSGITATWQVVATRQGVFVVTPSVSWNGGKVQANALRITVRAATPGGQRRAQPAPNPFDPFGMFPRLPGFLETPEPEPPPPAPADPELSLDAPLDSKIFLRSVVDRKQAVVGEQVTLTIYSYSRISPFEFLAAHEPSLADFFIREVMPAGFQSDPRAVAINGVMWRVKAEYRKALFPLRAGELEIGPMQATVAATRSSGVAGALRESQPLKVLVTEPSASGRPVGYQIGDVGAYTISATVEPRVAEVGGAIAVTINLAGVGNVPSSVRVPLSTSFDWLEPQVRENIEVENGKIRGTRTFSYVVRPKTAGDLDLGEVTLPFWDPSRKAYDVARASLGKVQITPERNASRGHDSALPHDPWSSLAPARDTLAAYSKPKESLTEKPFYWIGLFGAPCAVVVTSLGSKGVRRLRARLSARRGSRQRRIDEAMADARAAKKRQDPAALASALERAVYLAIERATDVKARALLLSEIPAALESRQVPSDLARSVCGVLSSIEAVRFAPDAAPSPGDLVDHVAEMVRRLGLLTAAGGA